MRVLCSRHRPVSYTHLFDVRVFSDFLQHEIVPGAVVADRERALDGLTVRCDHTDLVAALGDIDTDNEHNIHLNVDLQTVLMVLGVIQMCIRDSHTSAAGVRFFLSHCCLKGKRHL